MTNALKHVRDWLADQHFGFRNWFIFDPAMLSLPSLLSLIGLLQLFDLDFAHLQNGPHHAIRFLSVLVLHHLADVRGNDLSRNAEFVPEPAALFGFPPSESFFQSSSISFCVPQFAMNEMAG